MDSPDKIIAIYSIRQISTGIVYVGRSINLKRRWARHREELRRGAHHAMWLQRAWSKYGEHDFMFEVLEVLKVIEDIRKKEIEWLLSFEKTFNSIEPGKNTGVLMHSAETKIKMSKSQKIRFDNERENNNGRVLSHEHIKFMHDRRKATCGYSPSPETRARQSDAGKRKPPQSEETKMKISLKLRGQKKPRTEEHQAKITKAHKGSKHTEEHKEKIRQGLLKAYAEGRKKSPPGRAKT